MSKGSCKSQRNDCVSCDQKEPHPQTKGLKSRIRQTILVMSGKGGVGKSSVAANLAVWLSRQGKSVGLLDVDLHGPSIPKLLKMEEQKLFQIEGAIRPCEYTSNLKVMSIGFMLESRDTPVIWRGPAKHGFLEQCITGVFWGELDCLVVDCPPGTGDEVLSTAQLLEKADGAILVTTPQELALLDVRKCISFCRQLEIPIFGLIENMSGLVCPQCGKKVDVFGRGACQIVAEELGVPILGAVPMDPELARTCEVGSPIVEVSADHPSAQALAGCFEAIFQKPKQNQLEQIRSKNMKFAVPINDGRLSAHFGHCRQFAIVNADPESKQVLDVQMLTPPAHEPGVLPQWLSQMGVSAVIAGGMGQRAQTLFTEKNIEVIVGAPDSTPQELVQLYLNGQLECGRNVCDH